ncbi:TetR/AcrR family transcriptional regulator C-terminal domain-containing protein [Nocardioides sp. cx-169]|uniref:TetR/AcrR family transcriptional regulator C-terminal domain-containing protein n=1 Tax=Nocardioides sp. cx-169 TaxID=2899080 RepID=UPI001E5ACD98|nr:TetR/AcrR family transcriptional regulator C-terminal domain-containing protein [Nocardioides sp. cx-169]MCD4535957.1 TetR/AcrR family transcriptional regulator C-terminal domain-containing protein [Nocardioides sp. cx-169]
MRYHRQDVVERAIEVLDRYGLSDLTMRRLGSELGVQPSALYHHFANKQSLLAAVADEILARGERSVPERRWDAHVVAVCTQLRDAMLAYRDGADLVATVHAFGLGASAPYDALLAALARGGFPDDLSRTAARTLLHFVFGHAIDEQAHLQAGSAGAIDDEPRDASDFDLGLALVVDGIRLRQPTDLHQQL